MAGALSPFFESLSAVRVLVAAAVFLLLSMIFEFVILPPKYPKLPTVGHGHGLVAAVRNIVDYPTNFSKWLIDGHRKYGAKGLCFLTPRILSRSPDIVVPPSQTMWMLNQPDHVLSMIAANDSFLQMTYNFLDPVFAEDDFHSQVIHKNVARNLNKLIPGIQEEVAHAIDKAFGTNVDEWADVNLWDAWMTIVPIVTSRILVGSPMNRDQNYLSRMIGFTNCVVRNNMILNLIPKVLHPIFARLVTLDNWQHWKGISTMLIPLIQDRQRALERKWSGDAHYSAYELPDDFLSWAVKLAWDKRRARDYDPSMITKWLLPINFAAIHTTAITGHSLLLDLFSSHPCKRYAAEIREEAARVFAEEGGHWTKSGLQKLFKADSAIRESQRLSTFSVVLAERKVIAEEGITNEKEGWHAPKGCFLVLNYNAVHHSDELYADPNGYDAFRFSRQREESAAKGSKDVAESLKMAQLGMVTTSENHFPFGHGRHTCPGRFFAAYELKMALAYLLLNYDILPLDERPSSTFFGQVNIPPTRATLRVRRRAEPIVASNWA